MKRSRNMKKKEVRTMKEITKIRRIRRAYQNAGECISKLSDAQIAAGNQKMNILIYSDDVKLLDWASSTYPHSECTMLPTAQMYEVGETTYAWATHIMFLASRKMTNVRISLADAWIEAVVDPLLTRPLEYYGETLRATLLKIIICRNT